MEIHFGHTVDPTPFNALEAVRQTNMSDDGTTAIFVVEGSVDQVVKLAARYDVHNIVSHDGDLEDVFLEYYRSADERPVHSADERPVSSADQTATDTSHAE